MTDTTAPAGTDSGQVRAEVRGRVLVGTIGRPARRNAVDRAVADELDVALNRLDDPALWCGVSTGSGGFFCAGSDVTRTSTTSPPAEVSTGSSAAEPCQGTANPDSATGFLPPAAGSVPGLWRT
jgi:enoyl-CoA hydratase/carnithine racemase